MTFRVGQKVVCVDARTIALGGYPTGSELFKGRIYTVREIGLTYEEVLGLRLLEVELTSHPGEVGWLTRNPFVDAFYRAARFRPVVESKTDISIFTAMLKPSKVDA